MLESGDEKTLYNGDINQHVNGLTPLQMASQRAGQDDRREARNDIGVDRTNYKGSSDNLKTHYS